METVSGAHLYSPGDLRVENKEILDLSSVKRWSRYVAAAYAAATPGCIWGSSGAVLSFP